MTLIERLNSRIAAQAAEIARLKEDAERYRWLRDKSRPNGVCPFYLSVVEAFKDTIFRPETVDFQIDSAKDKS